ncbi:MAG: glucosamine-6-phosphate isomerase, partial [Clostridia bacterium]|nr:glucosamine-6-phosphate isomerase [Clostridia bacterium]
KHRLSFRGAMDTLFYDKINKDLVMPVSNRIFPSLTNSKQIENMILDHGGIDLLIGGIGINGHVAFNEPETEETSMETYKNRSVRVVKISPETMITNGINEFDGAYEFMPGYGITIGFKEILSAKKIRLYCFRNWHKMVVRKASFYPPSVTFPVTLLQGTDTRIGIPECLAD